MKLLRYMMIALVVTSCVLVCGCGKKGQDNRKTVISEEAYFNNLKNIYSYMYEGVLYMDEESRLCFTDSESGNKTLVCNRPNCEHTPIDLENETSECPAAFGSLVGAMLYKNNIYLFETYRGLHVSVEDMDGSNKKELISFDEMQFVSEALIKDDKIIILCEKTFEYSEDGNPIRIEPEYGIIVYNMETGKYTISYIEQHKEQRVRDLEYNNGMICFTNSYCDNMPDIDWDDYNENPDKYQEVIDSIETVCCICSLDPDAGEVQTETENINVNYLWHDENTYVYSDYEQYVYIYNCNTKVTIGYMDCVMRAVYYDGKLLYSDGEQWKIWECSTGEINVVCDVDKEHYINFCDRIKDRVYMSEAGDSDNLIILDIEELFQGKIYDGKKIYASIKS